MWNKIARRFPWAPAGAALLIIGLSLAAVPLRAQDAPPNPSPRPAATADYGYKPPLFYIHGAVGFGLDWMGSSEISDLMSPYKLGGFGFNYFAGLRIGVSNIAQLEFRADGEMLHDFWYADEETRVEMTNAIPRITLYKVNPLFWMRNKEITVFLVYGQGKNAKFYDKEDSGWYKGDVRIYGLELSMIKKSSSMGFGIEYRTVTYNLFNLTGFGNADFPFNGGFLLLTLHYGIGLGF